MQHSSPLTKISRRQFLSLTGAVLAVPTIIPISALGRADRPAPSGRITLGAVGCGGMGKGNTESFLKLKDCQVVAACDVDKQHLETLVGKVNLQYKDTGCKGYHDYRELMGRGDIDVIMMATPDHWHALAAVEAAQQKKDIYGEKPLARTIGEQQAIVRAVQANSRIWQTGSWQRSQANFHKAAEIVRNGMIGKVTRVEVGLPDGQGGKVAPEDMVPGTPPSELDYDIWIGPSKMMPYIKGRVHGNWRWNYNTGGGQLLDWVGHHCDIAHWGCDFDNSGPLEIEGKGEFPPVDAVWNTCTKYRIELKYPRDIAMTIAGGYPDIRSGTKWIGTEGWVRRLEEVHRNFPADAIYIFGHGIARFGVTGTRDDLLIMRDLLTALLEHVQQGIAAGRTKELIVALDNLPGFPDFHVPAPNRLPGILGTVYDELVS